jgi:hypothetical protein
VTTVGLRPPFVTPAAAHSHPDCRWILILIVAPQLLGHAKLDTTARYTQVATNIIREVMSPLDRLTPLVPKRTDAPPA